MATKEHRLLCCNMWLAEQLAKLAASHWRGLSIAFARDISTLRNGLAAGGYEGVVASWEADDVTPAETIREVRGTRPGIQMPVIFISDEHQESLRLDAITLGADDCLGINVEEESLVECMQLVLGQPYGWGFDEIDAEITEGTVEASGIGELIHLMTSSQVTGCLELQCKIGKGRVWFRDGDALDAESAARWGGEALQRMLGFPASEFTFYPTSRLLAPRPGFDPVSALIEGSKVLNKMGADALIHGVQTGRKGPAPTVVICLPQPIVTSPVLPEHVPEVVDPAEGELIGQPEHDLLRCAVAKDGVQSAALFDLAGDLIEATDGEKGVHHGAGLARFMGRMNALSGVSICGAPAYAIIYGRHSSQFVKRTADGVLRVTFSDQVAAELAMAELNLNIGKIETQDKEAEEVALPQLVAPSPPDTRAALRARLLRHAVHRQ